MLFSYMLHFFAIINAISVLAAPLPGESDEVLFDFRQVHDKKYLVEPILSDKGKVLARGDWLRYLCMVNGVFTCDQRCGRLRGEGLRLKD